MARKLSLHLLLIFALLANCLFAEEPLLANAENGISLAIPQGIANKRLAEYIHFDPNGPNQIGYLSIGKDRSIDQSTYLYVKFATDHFKELKVPFIVLDLNTPGGEVFAALKIADLLQKLDTNDHIPVIAFIDNWAISAGAMLAYSCRFIGVTKSSSMGAAEPVMVGQEGKMESASEKINSALRAEFANLANFYGRNPNLAEAMVDKDILLVYRGGKIIKLEDEKEVTSSDVIISKKGKLLTLNSEQLIDYGVADFQVPLTSLPPVTETELSEGKWPAEKSALFQESFLAKIPGASLVSYKDWRVDFFSFLSHPLISSLLFMGLIVGVYMELSHPGFGVPAFVALSCLGLILLSSFAIQAANWIEVIILSTGILLLLLELFVLTGFGVTGVLGILLTIAGLFAMMLPHFQNVHFSLDPNSLNLAAMAVLDQLAWLSGALIVSIIVVFVLARYFTQRLPIFKKLVLHDEQEGYVAGISTKDLPKEGSFGKAVSSLRPSGKIEVEDKLFDAITEGGFIDKGDDVKVLRLEGSKIIVQKSEKK